MKSPRSYRPLKPATAKRAIRRRFNRMLHELQESTRWTAKQLASNCHLPHRTVLNWLAGKACPGPKRLKDICVTFGWRYEAIFQSETLAGELFEERYLDFGKLTERYLQLRPADPLEAWGHVPLAGALVFVDLSASGFECRAIIDHNFGTRIEFTGSKQAALQVHVIYERGLVISWLDDQGLVRETRDLSDASLKIIKTNLRAVAGL